MIRRLLLILLGVTCAAAARTADPAAQMGLTFHAVPRALAEGAVVSEWPCLLGPTHDGVSIETKLLKTLPPRGPAIVWEIERGSGYAPPSVAGGRVVHFHRVEGSEVVDCLDAETGRRLWRHAYPVEYQDRYGYTDGPRCQPAIEAGRVYTLGVTGELHCLNLSSGELVWKHDLQAEFKLRQNFFGVGGTPLVEGGRLIVNVGAEGGPSVVAYDGKTGVFAWTAGKRYGQSYASPIPADIRGQRRVFVFAGGESWPPSGGLMCLDPASGKLDFEFDWRGKRRESVNASPPVVVGNRVFISECYGHGSAMVDVQADFTAKLLWKDEDFGTHFMAALVRDGYLYGFHGHGPRDCPLVCIEIATGREMWRHEPQWVEEVEVRGEKRRIQMELNRSHLLWADGRALCFTENGHLLWLDLNPRGYKELSRAWLFAGGENWSPPVLSRGLLYICQNSRDPISGKEPRLICYDLRGQ